MSSLGEYRRAMLVALGLLLLIACAPAPQVLSRRPEPSARVEAIQILSFERQRARLEAHVFVDNPGAMMTVHEAEYEVLLDARSFATGRTRVRTEVAADEKATVSIPIALAFLNVPRPVRERAERGEPVPLVVRGALHAVRAGESLAIEFDGETELRLGSDLD